MKIIYALVAALVISSCGITRNIGRDISDEYSFRVATKKENFQFGMYDIIRAYTSTYLEYPKTIRDLIFFIERGNKEMRMIRHPQYKYLTKHENNLRIVTDTATIDSMLYEGITTIYFKKIEKKRIVGSAIIEGSPCENIKSIRITLFDNNGYYFDSDSLRLLIENNVNAISRNHAVFLKPKDGNQFYRGVVKYTSEGLCDLCSSNTIDINNSPFFVELYKFLNRIAIENNISRMYIPSYLPIKFN